ncbi:MAG: alpha/beta hydrolase [Fimbriimonadales bacterium]|nr:alpha/beta hydrolase [Fimbriimonadales bacterium]
MTERRPRLAVMIHGAGGGGWEFRFWRSSFHDAGWTTLAEDLTPGRAGLARTSLADYLDQVLAWGAEAPDALIGASMGGLLALQACSRLRPRALILVNPVPPAESAARLPPRTWPELARWSQTTLEETIEALPDADREVAAWAAPRWRDESGRVLSELWSGASAPKPSCPCLVLVSEQDLEVPPACSEAVAAWCGAEVVRLPDASHVGPLLGRSATACARLTLNWLQETIGEGP